MDEYGGRQFVGVDVHRRRSVIVGMTEAGERLDVVRIGNDPLSLGLEIAKAGESPDVVLEATYGLIDAYTFEPSHRRCCGRAGRSSVRATSTQPAL